MVLADGWGSIGWGDCLELVLRLQPLDYILSTKRFSWRYSAFRDILNDEATSTTPEHRADKGISWKNHRITCMFDGSLVQLVYCSSDCPIAETLFSRKQKDSVL